MNKYVAFLDILGFKNRLKSLSQYQAEEYISSFSQIAYSEWEEMNPSLVEGYIVSDSFILYTHDTSEFALKELLSLIDRICKQEFIANSILIRGAIARGNFQWMEAKELASLRKGLLVGQAYVDAYLLEGTVKTTGIVVSDEVYQDIITYGCSVSCFSEKINEKDHFVITYLDFDFLNNTTNLSRFVELAMNAKWLPHYYNTLSWIIKPENNNKRIHDFFDKIIACIGNGNAGANYRGINEFIKNVFNPDVSRNFQDRFLSYLRERIVKDNSANNDNQIPRVNRTSSIEKVYNCIVSQDGLSKGEIADRTGVSLPTVSNCVKSLLDSNRIESHTKTTIAGKSIRTVEVYVKI